ncbi:hypothetical protein OAX51_00065 (plasmid) [Rhodococcus erythropolis]
MIPRLLDWVSRDISNTIYGSRLLGVGRTLMALAQLSVLLFTPSKYLFVPIGGSTLAEQCSSEKVVRVSAYCISPENHRTITYFMIAVLVVVASGILPRYTSVLHFLVSFSIGTAIALPDGGETVMQVMSFFIMIACLADGRLWHWQDPKNGKWNRPNFLLGVSWAGSWFVRIQIAYIYIHSGLAKLAVEQWRDGTATYYVSRMEHFGAAGFLDEVFRSVVAIPAIALLSTWGTIVIEVTLGILILVNRKRAGKVAIALCAFIHAWIAVSIGIISFAAIMLGAVIVATSYSINKKTSLDGGTDEHAKDDMVASTTA